MLSLAYHASPEDVQIYTVDMRYGTGGLGEISSLPHVRGHVSREEQLAPVIQQLYDEVLKEAS